jgi:hypothetical protein
VAVIEVRERPNEYGDDAIFTHLLEPLSSKTQVKGIEVACVDDYTAREYIVVGDATDQWGCEAYNRGVYVLTRDRIVGLSVSGCISDIRAIERVYSNLISTFDIR